MSTRSPEYAGRCYVQVTIPLLSFDYLMLITCTGPAYVDEATETVLAKVTEELKAVVTCRRQVEGRTLNLRFVKCEDVDSRANYNDISSTVIRNLMSKKHGSKLREALDWMALSADLLWWCKASWIDEAKLGTGCCINFPEAAKELHLPEKHRSYESTPSLGERGLMKVIEVAPPSEELPPLEEPPSHEISPSFEEPRSLEQHPVPEKSTTTNNKKRRFSETGQEGEIGFMDDCVGGGVLAEDAEV